MQEKGIVVTTNNIGSIFDSIAQHATRAAMAMSQWIDAGLLWAASEESVIAEREAHKLNRRTGRTLSVWDQRTRGYKHYQRRRREFIDRFRNAQPTGRAGDLHDVVLYCNERQKKKSAFLFRCGPGCKHYPQANH